MNDLLHGLPLLLIHVSAAITSYIFFIACLVAAVAIIRGKKIAFCFPVVCCETGILIAVETIVSGAYWASYAWGVPWVWDPRIIGMSLMTLFFISWRIVISILGDEAVANTKITATLIVLGIPAMFFTHAAVRLFGGIHPNQMPTSIHWEGWMLVLAIIGQLAIGSIFAAVRYKKMKKPDVLNGAPERDVK